MKVVIVTGLSGAGKTQAINCLEDMGYYCVDNMPPALIKHFLELTEGGPAELEKVALVIDVRGGQFFADATNVIRELKASASSKGNSDYKVIFLEASTDVLIHRFNETRRNHPLSESGNQKAGIEKEIELLAEVRKLADIVIDTSRMKSARLKKEVKEFIEGKGNEENFIINISSFGFKHGMPQEADVVFDVRFIPNPYYVESLKKCTGNNKKVRDYVMKQDITKSFIESFDKMVEELIPSYKREGKYHLDIAFGCTGGQHRSVVMANTFTEKFKEKGYVVTLHHRELD